MKRETAQELVVIVKNLKSYEALKEYAQDRIEFHRGSLETSIDFETVKYHQGAIQELKRIFSLYETVEQALKVK